MQETTPIVQAIATTNCDEDAASHQPPSKRKTRLHSQSKHGNSSSHMTPSSKQGNSSSQMTPSSRYTRSQAAPDWTVLEVMVLLSEIASIDEVWLKELSSYQRWKMISDSCMAMNVVRSSNQCKRKWEMLLDDYRKIMKWEPQSREDSYWFLSEERRKDYGLPVSFQKEIFDAMDAVMQVQEQQSDSNNSDPEQIISVPVFEVSNVNAVSEISVLNLPLPVHQKEELVTTSKSPEVEESTLKSPEEALVVAGLYLPPHPSENFHATSTTVSIGDELITISKSREVEESTSESPEKALVLAGHELIITSKRPEVEDLNTTSNNLEERPEVEELIITSKRLEVEELVTTPKSSEERLEVEELNTTAKRPEVEDLITTSKSPEVEDIVTVSKSQEVEELTTTSKTPEKALVIAVSEEKESITISKNSEVEELIKTSKSPQKTSVITVFEQEELITNSKTSEKARLITGKLQENAEHVCAILRGELQDGASHGSLPIDSLKPSAAETEFARRQADELIKALAELTNSLDELCDHINRPGYTGIVPVDSMA